MNQNFSFMKKFAPIIFNRKIITNRAATEYRKKCNIRDIMHCFTDLRTKNCIKLGDAVILRRPYWKVDDIPITKWGMETEKSPIPFWNWKTFAYYDGFDNFIDFIDFFLDHKKAELGFLCYHFRKIGGSQYIINTMSIQKG